MKKLFRLLKIFCLFVLASPLLLVWLPPAWLDRLGSAPGIAGLAAAGYYTALVAAFRELALSLGATLAFALPLTISLGYTSVLWKHFGKGWARLLGAVESVPAILVALFCYAPVSGYLARHTGGASQFMSLAVFILAATLTALPEAVRSITIPLSELYHRKYSLSFRSYGFTKRRILAVLMNTHALRDTIKRVAAGILLKTLVLDCSFGFIIQLGFGSYGTPAHLSPGALIAANRDALFEGGNPLLFWVPSVLLITISTALLLILGERKEVNI